jgi:tetratricopeptide (TPR) repeat protein
MSLVLLVAFGLTLQTGAPSLLDRLQSLDDRAAAQAVAADPAATRQALDELLKRFDASVHSDRQKPEQRRVQFDEEALAAGVRVGALYEQATGDATYARRFRARGARMEGTKLLNERRYRDAIGRLSEALKEAEALGDRWLETITRVNLSYGYLESNEPEQAMAQCVRANEVAAGLDDRARGLTLFNLGSMHLHIGDYAQTLEYSRLAVDVSRRIKMRIWEGNAELNISAAYRQLGNIPEARAALDRALAVLEQTGDRLGQGRALYGLGLMAAEQRQYAEAAAFMERALPIIRDVDIRHSHTIETNAADYRNPIEMSALQALVSAYTKLGLTDKAAPHQAALQKLQARPAGDDGHSHTHVPPK